MDCNLMYIITRIIEKYSDFTGKRCCSVAKKACIAMPNSRNTERTLLHLGYLNEAPIYPF